MAGMPRAAEGQSCVTGPAIADVIAGCGACAYDPSAMVVASTLRLHTPSFLLVLALYFLPSIVALWRRVINRGSVVVVNFFLGWTLLGWVIALAMACRTRTTRSG